MRNYKIKVIIISILSIFSVIAISGAIFIVLFGNTLSIPFDISIPFFDSNHQTVMTTTELPSIDEQNKDTTTITVTTEIDASLICIENAKNILLKNGKDQSYIDTISEDQLIAEAYNNPITTQRWILYNPPSSSLPYPTIQQIETLIASMKESMNKGNINKIISEYNNFSSNYNLNALQCEPIVSLFNDATLYKNVSSYLNDGNEDLFIMEVSEKFQSMDTLIYSALNGHEGLIYHRNDDLLPFGQSVTTEAPMYIQLSDPSVVEYYTMDPFASMYISVQFHTEDGTSYTAVGGMHEGYTKLLTIGRSLD